jgi:glycosyltransferase involved in cell wall biosynthesis
MQARIGINEVIIGERSSGTRQRELNMMPALMREVQTRGWDSLVYVANGLSCDSVNSLVGQEFTGHVVRTPLPAIPTYKRLLKGIPYWRKQSQLDELCIFHTSYYPIPIVNAPTVLTVNDLRFIHMPETYSRGRLHFLQMAVPWSLKRAQRIIAISNDTKNDLIERFSVDPAKIDVIHIAANPDFRQVEEQGMLQAARQRYRLPQKYILAVGHLEPRKNLIRLIQAFAALRAAKAVEHDLVILGKPTLDFKSTLETAKASAFAEHIIFTGYVEDNDMPAIYTLADALAFPSLHEGFGVPVLEAMACGVPVVTSNSSALPEVAGDSAIFVDPHSVDSIAKGLLTVLKDSGLRKRLIEKGFKRLMAFTPEAAAKKTCETYAHVIGS